MSLQIVKEQGALYDWNGQRIWIAGGYEAEESKSALVVRCSGGKVVAKLGGPEPTGTAASVPDMTVRAQTNGTRPQEDVREYLHARKVKHAKDILNRFPEFAPEVLRVLIDMYPQALTYDEVGELVPREGRPWDLCLAGPRKGEPRTDKSFALLVSSAIVVLEDRRLVTLGRRSLGGHSTARTVQAAFGSKLTTATGGGAEAT